MQSEQINEIAAALAAAQGEIENPPRNKKVTVITKKGGKYEFEYADLNAIIDAIKKPLAKNDIGYVQFIEEVEGKFRLITKLIHKSGQWIGGVWPLFLPIDKDEHGNSLPPTSQGFGGALTFMKRYALGALAGVAADTDDDANTADGNEAKITNKIKTVNAGDGKPLSDPQVEQLMLYAGKLDTDRITKFLAWLNVKSIDDIRAHQYERAMAGLRKAVGRTLGEQRPADVPSESSEAVHE